jgi:hypothetical protein
MVEGETRIMTETSFLIEAHVLESAKEAARKKIISVTRSRYLSHGFSRYGPVITKEGREYSPNPEHLDVEVDRLRGVLTHGLLSHNEAKRLGIRYSRNWGDQKNEDYVSLIAAKRPSGYMRAITTAAQAALGYDGELPESAGVAFAIIVNKSVEIADDDPLVFDGVFVKDKIATSQFIGIVADIVNPGERAQDAVDTMLAVYNNTPELALPFYTIDGDLFWPDQIGYKELENRIY